MPILYRDVIQQSDEYDRLKLGIPTSSQFKRLITPARGKASGMWMDFAYQLLAERCLMRRVDQYTSPAMDRGQIVEAEAVAWYSWETGSETEVIGFITDDQGRWGCSPDRLVGDNGLLELKCPLAKDQMRYWVTHEAHVEHRPQLQGQLLISEREWVDLVCWHPELPRVVIRVEPDEEYQARLLAELERFTVWIDTVTKKLIEVGAIGEDHPWLHRLEQRPTAKATLKQMLQDTLGAPT
jgi:hypothetical protein